MGLCLSLPSLHPSPKDCFCMYFYFSFSLHFVRCCCCVRMLYVCSVGLVVLQLPGSTLPLRHCSLCASCLLCCQAGGGLVPSICLPSSFTKNRQKGNSRQVVLMVLGLFGWQQWHGGQDRQEDRRQGKRNTMQKDTLSAFAFAVLYIMSFMYILYISHRLLLILLRLLVHFCRRRRRKRQAVTPIPHAAVPFPAPATYHLLTWHEEVEEEEGRTGSGDSVSCMGKRQRPCLAPCCFPAFFPQPTCTCYIISYVSSPLGMNWAFKTGKWAGWHAA